jgi:hypothetical protein
MSRSRLRRRWLSTVALAFSSLFFVATALPAQAAGPGTYVVSRQDGVPFPLLTSNNLLLGSTDDALFRLTTHLSGANHMPFPITVYGNKFTTMTVSSNGNVQFGVCCTGGTTAYSNTSLPSSTFGKSTLAVFWDDLYFTPDDTGHFFREGIFTKTSGTAPHRTFVISWQGHAYNSESYFALAQVKFTEGSQTIRYIYGGSDLQAAMLPSETIGLQGPGGLNAHATQVAFNPSSPATAQGRQYTFQHVN